MWFFTGRLMTYPYIYNQFTGLLTIQTQGLQGGAAAVAGKEKGERVGSVPTPSPSMSLSVLTIPS